MRIIKYILLLWVCFLSAETINVQGVLRDSNNQVVADNSYALTFEIYDSESGGSYLWTSTVNQNIANGMYSVDLDIGDLLESNPDLWLSIGINGEFMSSRSRLNVPSSISQGTTIPVGTIYMFAGVNPPDGWLLCDGSPLPTDPEYDNLDNLLDETYGASSGRSLTPNLQGKVGLGSSNSFALGVQGGEYGPSHIPHSHSATSSVNDSGHSHSVSDPEHTHGITDPGHNHSINNPAHNHGVSDPGHNHGDDDFRHYSWGWDGNMATGSGGGQGSTTVDSNTTVVSVNNATTNISNNSSTTGISNGSSYTGIGMNSATTGVSVSTSTGNDGEGDQSYGNMMPYTVINYIIKY